MHYVRYFCVRASVRAAGRIYILFFVFSAYIVMMPNRQIFGIESYAFFIITVFTRVSAALLFKLFTSKYGTVRTCLHEGGGPQVGEVTRLST